MESKTTDIRNKIGTSKYDITWRSSELYFSIAFHFIIILIILFGTSFSLFDKVEDRVIAVEILPISGMTNIKPQERIDSKKKIEDEKKMPKVVPKPKSEPEKPKESKPEKKKVEKP